MFVLRTYVRRFQPLRNYDANYEYQSPGFKVIFLIICKTDIFLFIFLMDPSVSSYIHTMRIVYR